MKRLRCVLFVFIFLGGELFAQFYSTGQDPSNTKWKQIKSDHFQIVFDAKFEPQAQKVANILEYYYKLAGKSLNHQPKKITVILHNQTIRSNGYVSWAPKRMELYATPPQDVLPDPWLEHLCLHELRHVVQIDKLNQGITKILSVIFGQTATGMAAGQLPLWYYEGDAVGTETAFGNFGRGRSPMFEKNIKTHLLSDEKRYTLDQFLFGSYKSKIPNHYESGYLLTSYLRAKYNKNPWTSVQDHVAKNSFMLIPTPLAFSRGLIKQSGLNQKMLLEETLNYCDSIFTSDNLNYKPIESLAFQRYQIEGYEDYINPVYTENQRIIALKKGLGHIPQFVFVDSESEKKIVEPGILVSEDFSYAKKYIVWAEHQPHFRWQNKEYSVIKMYNVDSKTERWVAKKTRYFSPDISQDANKIAVIEVDEKNNYFLTIISSFKGDIIERIPSVNFIQRPKWSADNKSVYVIELTETGKQVSHVDLVTKDWIKDFDVTDNDIQRIIPSGNFIFYHSTDDNKDQIYVYDSRTEGKYKLSHSGTGIVDFCIDTNARNIYAAEYTAKGNRIVKIPLERGLWQKQENEKKSEGIFSAKLTDQENFTSQTKIIPDNLYPVKRYSRIANLFNFHSWVPFYFDYSNNSVGGFLSNPEQIMNNIHPGLMLLSQNKLSTAESIISYAYKEDHHFLQTSFVYKGFLPIIKFSASYGDLHQYLAPSDVTWQPELKYDDYSYSVDVYLPISFSTGKMFGGFIPRAKLDYFNTFYYQYQNDYYIKGNEFLTSQLYFYWLKRRSGRDLQPRSGISIDLKLYSTPFENELFGNMSNAEGTLYLPGIFRNDGIKINVGHQVQEPVMYLFNSQFAFPHGIEKFRTERLTKLYIDYVFPLAYPDFSIGTLLYIKRIKGDVFYNYAQNKFKAYNQQANVIYWATYDLVSCGLELSVDYHLLRMIFPLNTGIRLGYTNYPGKVFYEFIFNIDLSGV